MKTIDSIDGMPIKEAESAVEWLESDEPWDVHTNERIRAAILELNARLKKLEEK